MGHKFDPANLHKLDNPRRRELLPLEPTLRRLGLAEGMRAVDIGCGSGFFAIPAAEIVGNDGKLYGFDIAPQAVALCEEKARDQGLTNAEFHLMEETGIPLNDATVDFVLMANVAHELSAPVVLLRDVHRILVPGGSIAVVEWKNTPTEGGPPLDERLGPKEVEALLIAVELHPEQRLDLGPTHYARIARRA